LVKELRGEAEKPGKKETCSVKSLIIVCVKQEYYIAISYWFKKYIFSFKKNYSFVYFISYFSILIFEKAMKDKERPKGVAPKRDLSSLP